MARTVACLLGAVALLSAVLSTGAAGSPPGEGPEPTRPRLRLVPQCRVCAPGDIGLHLHASAADDSPLSWSGAMLVVEDSAGETVVRQPAPIGPEPLAAGHGMSSNGMATDQLRTLPAGDYRVTVALADGLRSNSATFTVDDAHAVPPPLEILAVDAADADGDELLAVLSNAGSETLHLPGVWFGSQLWIDGVMYRRAVLMWAGPGDLAPGDSWGVLVDLDGYRNEDKVPLPPGTHQVELVMAGFRSNPLQIVTNRPTCRGPVFRQPSTAAAPSE